MAKAIHPRSSYVDSGTHNDTLLFNIFYWRFRKIDNIPLYPFAVEETIRSSRFTYCEKFCRLMIVVLMLEGELTYHANSKRFIATPGQALVIPPGTNYDFSHTSGLRYHKLVLELKGSLLNSISSYLGFKEPVLIPLESFDEIQAQIRALGTLLESGQRKDIPQLLGDSYSVLYRLSTMLHDSAATTSGILQAAQAILESNLDEPLNLEDLPRRLGVSATTLNRLFREKLNISPGRYRNSCRIEYAREMLFRSNLSIKEIAAMTGYCNQFYFSQEFRKITGISPLQYRRKSQEVGRPFIAVSEQ